MGKHILSDKEIIKGMLVIVMITAAPVILMLLIFSLIVGFYLVRVNDFWLFGVIGGWIGLFFVILSSVQRNYRLQKKLSGNKVELLVTDTKIIYGIGELRSEIPYSIIKKAYFRFGHLFLKIISGGVIAISINKLSSNEQKKLMEKLGLTHPE